MAAPRVVDPPVNDPPMVDYPSGQRHSQAWTEYNQAVADRLADNTAAIAAIKTGVTDGSSAAAGQIGEFLTASGGATPLTTATPADIVTLALTAGEYEVWGAVNFSPNVATQVRQVIAWVSDASVTSPGDQLLTMIAALFVDGAVQNIPAPPRRFTFASPATMYLSAQAIFGVSTCGASGSIFARRVR